MNIEWLIILSYIWCIPNGHDIKCQMQSCYTCVWSLNMSNTTISRNEVVVTSLIPAIIWPYNSTQCRHNIMMAIHSIQHYRCIIYCNWLWCCDPPTSATIHLMIVSDSFCSIISNLSLPPFPMTHPRMHTTAFDQKGEIYCWVRWQEGVGCIIVERVAGCFDWLHNILLLFA